MTVLYDSQGQPISLERELGSGGEGAVYDLSRDPTSVAKLYHQPPPGIKAEKLRYMVSQGDPALIKISAWPTKLLFDRAGGTLRGFIMPKVAGYEPVHHLYNPAYRRMKFPKADWAFLLRAARNCAIAFAEIHSHGHVIGDVNQGNIVVACDALIKLIDCDSFQLLGRGRQFLCEVGVGHFTPPELQGRSFNGIVRSPNHDNFGLAVLIFHLLFVGRHPFAGRFFGPGDMPIEKAISESRFAFSSRASAVQMQPPPHVPGLSALPPRLAQLFEQAFSASNSTAARPSAVAWEAALAEAEAAVHQCDTDTGHRYYRQLRSCPWCEIEGGGGPPFFASAGEIRGFEDAFDFAAFWAALSRVKPPPDAAALRTTPGPKSRTPEPVPPAARLDLVGAERAVPRPPPFVPEQAPEAPPPYMPETIPGNPVLVEEPLPPTPPVPPPVDDQMVEAKFTSLRPSSEHQMVRAVTIAVLPLLVPLFWLPPDLRVLMGLVGLVILLPFALTWTIYAFKFRRMKRTARPRIRVQLERERDRMLGEIESVKAMRQGIERRNARRREEWEHSIQELERRRREAPERERERKRQWERDVSRVESRRQKVVERNALARQRWQAEVDRLEPLIADAEAHNRRVLGVKQAYHQARLARLTTRDNARIPVDRVRQRWAAAAATYAQRFQAISSDLLRHKAEYEQLKARYESEKQHAALNQRPVQLRDFLDNKLIEHARIDGIGTGRKATLASYGIETAADITDHKLRSVPGFGPHLCGRLTSWRAALERGFRFNPHRALPKHELRQIQLKYQPQKKRIEQQLKQGKANLEQISREAEQQLLIEQAMLPALVEALAQAEVNLAAMPDTH